MRKLSDGLFDRVDHRERHLVGSGRRLSLVVAAGDDEGHRVGPRLGVGVRDRRAAIAQRRPCDVGRPRRAAGDLAPRRSPAPAVVAVEPPSDAERIIIDILGARLIAVEPYAPAQSAERSDVEVPELVEAIA